MVHATPAGPVPDDSSSDAHRFLLGARGTYGGMDLWEELGAFTYFVTYRIPGPDGATVRQWDEAHVVWAHAPDRVRIDNTADSTVITLSGDTTRVRRGGVWTRDPQVLDAARQQALDALWLQRLPWNLFDARLVRRIVRPAGPGTGARVLVRYPKGEDRPESTVVVLDFDPDSYVMRSILTYDPRVRAWFRLDLASDRTRFGWTFAESRTLYASDSDGRRGPVVWSALLQDMQLARGTPESILHPPGSEVAPAPGPPAGTPTPTTGRE